MTESTATSAGLKGVVAGRSSICLIDGEQGLLAYRGYDIHDLAKHSTFEETTYLLWEGKLPTRADLADFTTMLAEQRSVPESVLDLIVNSPIDAPPMATLRTPQRRSARHYSAARDAWAPARRATSASAHKALHLPATVTLCVD